MFHVKHRGFASFFQSAFKTQQSRPFGRLVLQGNVYLFYQTTQPLFRALSSLRAACGGWPSLLFYYALCGRYALFFGMRIV